MKKFTKAGAKFAAAAAVSLMALGYTTSVWAEESSGITNKETVFANIKGTRTESLSNILFKSTKDKTINEASALRIQNVDELNLVNEDEHGLYIGNRTYAFENAEGIGINVEKSQANFDIEQGLVIDCRATSNKNAEGIGINVNGGQANFDINGYFGVLAQGFIQGTEANVSMRAVGFSGEKGSSQIKAESVYFEASNWYYREDSTENRETPTGTLVEESLGMALNNYAMNIFAEKDIKISSFILNNTELTGKKTAQGMVLSNGSKASLQADGNISISAAVGYDAILTRAMPAISFGSVNGIHAVSSELDMQAGGKITIEVDSTGNNNLAAINANDSKIDMKAEQGIEIIAANGDAIVADNSEIALDGGSSGIAIRGNVNVSNNSVLKLSGVTSIGVILMRSVASDGDAFSSDLNVKDSTLVVDGLVTTSGTTTLNNAKIYMYDANNAEDAFHTLSIKNLDIAGSNELFLRADSSKEAWILNSDVIDISGIGTTITGEGKFDVNVFDKGMKVYPAMGDRRESIDVLSMPEFIQSAKCPDNDVEEAVVFSYFESGATFQLPCKVNKETHEIFDVTYAAMPCDDDCFSYEEVKINGKDYPVNFIDDILLENNVDDALDEFYRIQQTGEYWQPDGNKTLDDAIHECRWAILKNALMQRGHDAVADFIGTDVSSDSYERLLDETEAQMPSEEFEKFWEKYI